MATVSKEDALNAATEVLLAAAALFNDPPGGAEVEAVAAVARAAELLESMAAL